MSRVRPLVDLRTMIELGRWLGPWTDGQAAPHDVTREELSLEGRRAGERGFSAFVYRSRRQTPVGSLLLVPGLHYLGPLDPRMDRFARILATAGLTVLAPRLPDFTSLVLGEGVFDDLSRAFSALLALPGRPPGRPGVFSISFGSLPSLWLAARSRLASEVGTLIVFGGYADFGDTLRFCIHGRPGAAHDPLNRPVVFMNLLPWLHDKPDDPAPLVAALRKYVEATWGRPEMKVDGKWQVIARAVADELAPAHQPLFYAATGVSGDTKALVDAALGRSGDAFTWLDPGPLLGDIRCPVHFIHGADDDVIPYEQAFALAKRLPAGVCQGIHVTGLYGHTHKADAGTTLRGVPALVREGATLLKMLSAVARCGRG
ncbi:alpha/beta hydrolase [Polyangium sorediatum]|uniref:Alpha/beta hydrolase n=1 Tax=Polyangium sorediatum TaxID=889274 RepID=A0ABT6NM05_9BACT|nr:alpha/beta hydrolase [Polyangium sorediatum]MDI1429260.1 alpha/beta hydrolase [Polyangium sorediatum]